VFIHTAAPSGSVAGPYRTPAAYGFHRVVFTNTTPTTAYRGAARPNVSYIVERLVEEAAKLTGIDSIELRRRNLISKDAYPYKTPIGVTYDSGDPAGLLEDAMKIADWKGFKARRQESKRRGKLRGRGVAVFVEPSGGGIKDEVAIKFGSSGNTFNLFSPSGPSGQGHETVFPEIVADVFGIDPHTRSNRLLIEGNTAHHNGKQGIILAEECTDSIIRGNMVYANNLHGIVLYQRSNNNLVENNIAYGNGLQGININNSSNNTLRGNTTYANSEAGIGVGQQATNNRLEGNLARDNAKDGIYFYNASTGNTLRDNIVHDNMRYGIYVKSAGNTITSGNQVFDNTIGIYLNVKPAPEVSLEANRIHNNHEANVRVGGG
jgi:parallel beta-helix repeat protein